jgi:hypothetical protein
MKFEKAFEAFATFLETLSEAMTAANSINPVVNFFSVHTCHTGNKIYNLLRESNSYSLLFTEVMLITTEPSRS